MQIYDAQPTMSPIVKLKECIPVPRLVAMAMATLMPPKEIWGQVLAAVRVSTLLQVVHDSVAESHSTRLH